MSRRATLLGLALLTVALLPGCAVSLFSEATRNPETDAMLDHLEQRMDAVDAQLEARSAK